MDLARVQTWTRSPFVWLRRWKDKDTQRKNGGFFDRFSPTKILFTQFLTYLCWECYSIFQVNFEIRFRRNICSVKGKSFECIYPQNWLVLLDVSFKTIFDVIVVRSSRNWVNLVNISGMMEVSWTSWTSHGRVKSFLVTMDF